MDGSGILMIVPGPLTFKKKRKKNDASSTIMKTLSESKSLWCILSNLK